MTDAFTTNTTDPVAELVGEGKKFKDVAALAAGKKEADQFIEQLKNELAEMRKEIGQKVDNDKTLNELREEIRRMKEQPANRSTEQTPPSVSESDLKALIAITITEEESRRTSAQNIVSANNAVVRHYGSLEKAQEQMRETAQKLGLTIDELKATAAKSPTAFIKLVLPEKEQSAVIGDFSGTVNTDTLTRQPAGGPQEGTKEYFDALRKSNPKLYWTSEVQNKIYKAAQAGTYDYNAGLERS